MHVILVTDLISQVLSCTRIHEAACRAAQNYSTAHAGDSSVSFIVSWERSLLEVTLSEVCKMTS